MLLLDFFKGQVFTISYTNWKQGLVSTLENYVLVIILKTAGIQCIFYYPPAANTLSLVQPMNPFTMQSFMSLEKDFRALPLL